MPVYTVDVIDDKHNDRMPAAETNMTFDSANRLALGLWLDGKHAQVLSWEEDNGYTVVANYG